jgi:hypothetical protein
MNDDVTVRVTETADGVVVIVTSAAAAISEIFAVDIDMDMLQLIPMPCDDGAAE